MKNSRFTILFPTILGISIVILLFVLPFFWINPGEFDIGGDSSRLYLYDPLRYLVAIARFGVYPEGTGRILPNYNLLPFLSILAVFQGATSMSHVMVVLEKSMKFSFAFLFLYLNVKELWATVGKKHATPIGLAAVLAGAVYVFSPAVVDTARNALLTHNQVFLNPLLFYLVLRFVRTHKASYLWWTIAITVIFSQNFTMMAPPPPFAFYPLVGAFLFAYQRWVIHRPIPRMSLILAALFFTGLHAFHLIPEIVHIMDPTSELNQRVAEVAVKSHPGLEYFFAVLPQAKVSAALLLFSPGLPGQIFMGAIPLILLLGFLIRARGRSQKTFVLLAIFFLVTLFLVSAKITGLGVHVYKLFFSIPGFSMFRNFSGQFQFVYTFFYALVFGFAAGKVFLKIKIKYAAAVTIFIMVMLIYRAEPFLSGDIVNFVHDGTLDARAVMRMDPKYEETLSFIRTLPTDGKVLTLPLSDFYMQVLFGINDGAYVGPSTISFLAGRNDFPAYQMLTPFSEVFMRLASEKNYADIETLLGLLNIRYIFHNEDPRIYEERFPARPYAYMRTVMPQTQRAYADFVAKLGGTHIYTNGSYRLYELPSAARVPLFVVPHTIVLYSDDGKPWLTREKTFFASGQKRGAEAAYLLREHCREYLRSDACTGETIEIADAPEVTYKKITPSKYEITVHDAYAPYVLVFSAAFGNGWKLLGNNYASVDSHFPINGYANAWYIVPGKEANDVQAFVLMADVQSAFTVGVVVSGGTALLFVGWGLWLWRKKS